MSALQDRILGTATIPSVFLPFARSGPDEKSFSFSGNFITTYRLISIGPRKWLR